MRPLVTNSYFVSRSFVATDEGAGSDRKDLR
jgi:hypothetical protein